MQSRLIQKDRLAALSDGVIAVMITLMFLGFEGSYQDVREARSSAEVWAVVTRQLPQFLAYCLSFLFIGGYWLKQHLIFHYVEHVDRVFIGLNFLFLMCMSIVPIATDWLVESAHHEFNAILIFYALSYTVCSLTLAATWVWATMGRRLTSPRLKTETVRSIYLQIAIDIATCLLGVAASFVTIELGMSVLALAALVTLCPVKTDGHWMQVDPAASHESSRTAGSPRHSLPDSSNVPGAGVQGMSFAP